MKLRLSILSAIAILTIAGAAGAGPSETAVARTTTESACASCHRERSQTQPQTPMGRAMTLTGANPVSQNNPKLTVRKGPYAYTVETRGAESTYSVSDGTRTITVPIRWNFGAGAQTWMLDYKGRRYESAVSFYPSIPGLDFTTGDEDLKPQTLEEAIGRQIFEPEVKVCFGCHTTNSFSNGKVMVESMSPGVTCEHCHTGSIAHITDAVNGDYDSAPRDLRKLSSEDISNFCGQCHRSWETVVRNHWRGKLTVRFQPYRLANSKCFDGADPRISCIGCHDPHVDLVRNDSSYDSKCLACHSSGSTSVAGVALKRAPPCPKAQSECVSCHMPKVKLPNGHLTFTDHQIRIVRAGEKFPN
ncbi:MAG: multiheme c-type cytochrome [Candidatus Sulfotelmatobacter sp.]